MACETCGCKIEVRQIAKELGISQKRVSEVIPELEKRGWIWRDPHKKVHLNVYAIDEILDDALKSMKRGGE